jgi:hypothetical protein
MKMFHKSRVCGFVLDLSGSDIVQWWALKNTVMDHRVPQKADNFFTGWVTISF